MAKKLIYGKKIYVYQASRRTAAGAEEYAGKEREYGNCARIVKDKAGWFEIYVSKSCKKRS